jgi:SH3-like domain-containing protein
MQMSIRATSALICAITSAAAAYLLFPSGVHSADRTRLGDVHAGVDESGAAAAPEDTAHRSTNLPLPRFVSLRTDPINMRTGPGVRYPVDWVYTRRGLPVEVVAEFDTWRRISDPDGSDGWVHTSMLSARRTAVVSGGLQPLRRTSEDHGDLIARLEPDVVVSIQKCPTGSYCRVKVKGMQGWVRRDHLWGVYPDEVLE